MVCLCSRFRSFRGHRRLRLSLVCHSDPWSSRLDLARIRLAPGRIPNKLDLVEKLRAVCNINIDNRITTLVGTVRETVVSCLEGGDIFFFFLNIISLVYKKGASQ